MIDHFVIFYDKSFIKLFRQRSRGQVYFTVHTAVLLNHGLHIPVYLRSLESHGQVESNTRCGSFLLPDAVLLFSGPFKSCRSIGFLSATTLVVIFFNSSRAEKTGKQVKKWLNESTELYKFSMVRKLRISQPSASVEFEESRHTKVIEGS